MKSIQNMKSVGEMWKRLTRAMHWCSSQSIGLYHLHSTFLTAGQHGSSLTTQPIDWLPSNHSLPSLSWRQSLPRAIMCNLMCSVCNADMHLQPPSCLSNKEGSVQTCFHRLANSVSLLDQCILLLLCVGHGWSCLGNADSS